MTRLAEHLRAELAELPAEDRAELAGFLIASLDEGEDADAETAWDAELVRRGEQIERDEVHGERAENVYAHIRRPRR